MDKKDEKALEEKSKIQKDAEETLPGRQLGLYSKVDKKEVRNMVSEINPDKNSLGSSICCYDCNYCIWRTGCIGR